MKLLALAHGVDAGAARDVQAIEDASLESGGFYGSAGMKMSGPLTLQDTSLQPLLTDADFEAAVGRLTEDVVLSAQA